MVEITGRETGHIGKSLFFPCRFTCRGRLCSFLDHLSQGLVASRPLVTFGLFARFMQAIYLLAYYAYGSLYPVRLSPVYTQLVSFDPAAWPMVLSLLGVAGTAAGIFFMRKRWPLVTAVSLSYVILLVPVLGFFEHPHYPGDRYSLLSALGLLVCFRRGGSSVFQKELD